MSIQTILHCVDKQKSFNWHKEYQFKAKNLQQFQWNVNLKWEVTFWPMGGNKGNTEEIYVININTIQYTLSE